MKQKNQFQFRLATEKDIPKIWEILQQAITRRKLDGSSQWQSGYPNLNIVKSDIENNTNYVLVDKNEIIGTAVLIFNYEPTYNQIDGAWLTEGEFMVVHRIAVDNQVVGKGLGKVIFEKFEKVALSNQIYSIKIDTNFDNLQMLRLLEKLGYIYCGEIQVYDGARKAFEKVLK